MTITETAPLTLVAILPYAIIILEGAGIAVILVGAAIASFVFVRRFSVDGFEGAYRRFRAVLGRTILMGLEFLVAADILKSLLMPHQLENLLGLALLMLARTFLSLSLNVEINGHWPWHETQLERERSAKGK
jgi:uncharacterized membrane protein